MLADIDGAALKGAADALSARHGADVVRSVEMNVTDENQVVAAYSAAAVEFGGIDILVSNAGIASSAPIEETSLALWNRNMDILSTGYFLVSREAFKLFRTQGTGGSVIFVASKNGLAASPNAAAYCTAKAAEIHLARCLALEGAEAGIRVNVVNPDAKHGNQLEFRRFGEKITAQRRGINDKIFQLFSPLHQSIQFIRMGGPCATRAGGHKRNTLPAPRLDNIE